MGGAFLGVAALVGGLLLVGGCVWGLLGLLIMKEISVLEFVVYMGLFLGLILMGGVGQPPLGSAAIFIAIILAIAFPLMRQWGNAHALAKMERADLERYLEAVKQRPDIPYSYRRLAEIHFKRGHYEQALDWYQQYLELAKDPDVKYRVKRCMEMIERAGERVKTCTECHHENSADARYCVECGAILPGVWEIVEAFRGKQGTRYLITVAVLCLALGIILGVVVQLNHIYMMLCFWIAAAAFVYLIYKRVTMY